MKKVQRILSGLLVLCMLLTLVPATALAAGTADSGTGAKPTITRLAGEDRFKTAFTVAEELKLRLGVQKFDAIVVAYGANFPDALSGSYLAAVKKAPILLSYNEQYDSMAVDYIRKNLNPNGTVYLLGGTNVVSESFESALREFHVKRLAGENRFETNLAVLEEAGVGNKPILVCTGLSFADSLSASATELPILLVYGNELLPSQAAFLEGLDGNDLFVIGGTSAVSETMEQALAEYSAVGRVAGKNRFETSVAIAESFFSTADQLVLAYGWNFPDGLCGGSLAAAADMPLVLTMEGWETSAVEYAADEGVFGGYVLGGEKLISDASAELILNNGRPDESIPEEPLEEEYGPEIQESVYLPDRPEDFTFLVSCDWGEEYLRKNLKLTGEAGNVPYSITEEEDGVYRIAATELYQQYQTYYALGAEGIRYPEYNAKALEFSIVGPDRAEIEFNEENLVFLKALELEQYGTSGMYELEWDELDERYYLTLFELEDLDTALIGKVMAIGDYVNTDEILEDGTRELCFAKLESIERTYEGDLLLELSVPEVSDVYNKLDIYFAATSGAAKINGDVEQVFIDTVMNSDDFAEYLATVQMAVESYAEDHGLEVMPLSEDSEDRLKFHLTDKDFSPTDDGDACVLKLGGDITYTIPLDAQAGIPGGSIEVTCRAGIEATISAGGHYKHGESVELYLTNTTTTTLGFEIVFKLEYGYEYETKYMVNKNSQTIHTATCRHVTGATNPENFEEKSAQDLSDKYNGDKDEMRRHECKTCKPVTSMNRSAYAYNTSTKKLHCMHCSHVGNTSNWKLYTLYPDNNLEFTTCEDCKPEEQRRKDFDNRMLNAVQGSDWEEQVDSFREMMGWGLDGNKPSLDKNPKLTVPINVWGVFNISIGVEPIMEFEMEASADFEITSTTTVTYGIRGDNEGFEPIYTKIPEKPECRLSFSGEAEAKFGIKLFVAANPVGLEKAARIEISGQIGLYAHLSGIFAVEGTIGGDADAYCAARLDVGLYVRMDGYWKILIFDNDFEIVEEKREPLLKWGYDRMYYTFEDEETEWIVNGPEKITVLSLTDVMYAKYLNLTNMEYAKGVMPISQFDVTVDITNPDGTPCEFLTYVEDLGRVVKKAESPAYFDAVVTIQVEPKIQIDSLADFIASQSRNPVYGCDMDPLVVNVKVGAYDPDRERDQILGVYKGSYFASQGETGLTLTVYKEGNEIKALFDFYNLPGMNNARSGKYYMDVSYDAETEEYYFKATEWIVHPFLYQLLDLQGKLEGDVLSGDSPTTFSVTRVQEEVDIQAILAEAAAMALEASEAQENTAVAPEVNQ